jgi:hypothetical protein
VRCLLVVPLLIFAEATRRNSGKAIANRLRAVVVSEADAKSRFDGTVARLIQVSDASLPWVLIIGAAPPVSRRRADPRRAPRPDRSPMPRALRAVRHMRIVPITKVSIAMILVPPALPFAAVAALQIPLKGRLLNLVKLLV